MKIIISKVTIIYVLIFIMFSSIRYCSFSSVNLASRRPTIQISTYRSQKSDLAVDGKIETWSVTGNIDVIPDDPQLAWWSVTLDRVYYVKNIILSYDSKSPYKDYLDNIIVYVSVDAVEYLTCAYVEHVANGLNLTCKEGLYGNVVHIAKNGGTRVDILALCEVSIHGEAYRLGINLAIKKQTSQSGTHIRKTSDLAVDGNDKTCSVAQSTIEYSTLAWWQVDLNGTYYIHEVIITYFPWTAYFDFLHGFIIFASNDAENFEQLICSTFDEAKHFYKESTLQSICHKDVFGKFVTIARSRGVSNVSLGLCEVQVFGEVNLDTITLSYKRPTAQGGVVFTSTSSLAVDGKLETCARVYSSSNKKAWWRVALDNIYTISNISILFDPKNHGYGGYMSHFNVFVSTDEENQQQQLCASFEEGEGNITLTCNYDVAGLIVTIEKYGGPKPKMMHFCEVLIYPQDADKICAKDSIRCESLCVTKEKICDHIKHCSDGRDELNCDCPDSHYKCKSGQCIHKEWLCDSVNDCPDGDDENITTCVTCSWMEFRCLKDNKCITIDKRCDGEYDCPDSSDEDGCLSIEETDGSSKQRPFLKAIYKAEPNFFICSSKWWSKFSLQACKNMDRKAHLSTSYKKTNATNILMLKSDNIKKSKPYLHPFEKSTKCKSGKFIQLECSTASKSDCGTRKIPKDQLGPYIVNGDKASLGAWPWHVQLINHKTSKHCGGTLLRYNWVLTSANCLENMIDPSVFYVKIGTVKNDDPMAKIHNLSRIIMHPDYLRTSIYGDIALLKINGTVRYSPFISPICLPSGNVLQSFIPYCIVTGFGNLDNEYFGWSLYLRQGRMNILENKHCKKVLLDNDVPNETVTNLFKSKVVVCGGSVPTNIGVNICRGDFGGPLACKMKNERWSVVGVASNTVTELMSKKCMISIFNKVDPYINFIKKTMTID